MTLVALLVAVPALLIALFAAASAIGMSFRLARVEAQSNIATRVAVILARAVADHDVVEKVIAGTPFEADDDLDRLLQATALGEVDIAQALLGAASKDGGPGTVGRPLAAGGSSAPLRTDPPAAPRT